MSSRLGVASSRPFEQAVARADSQRQRQLTSGAAGLTRPLLGLEPRDRDSDGDGDSDGEPASRSAQPGPDIGFAVAHSFYWLTANLAETGPLMLAIDDTQFADLLLLLTPCSASPTWRRAARNCPFCWLWRFAATSRSWRRSRSRLCAAQRRRRSSNRGR